jgi:hypothetical protein
MNTLGRTRIETESECRQGVVCLGCRIVWILLLALILSALNLSGEEIDRLLVAVNGSVITEGDLYIARKLNPLIFSISGTGAVSREAEIDRLIDLELIRQELQNFSLDSDDESSLDAKTKEWRDRMTKAGIDLHSIERLGIQESELNSYLKLRISILEFVDFRFGPFAAVSESEIKAYYDDTYSPQLRESGLETPPLSQVSDKIEEILKDKKINEALDQWLLEARSNAQIEYFDGDSPAIADSADLPERLKPGSTE